MPHIEFIVSTKPIPKARPRFTRTGHCFTPKTTTQFEHAVRAAYNAQCGNAPLTGSLSATIAFTFQKPLKTVLEAPRADVDNLVKSILDALNGAAYSDDSQITRLTASKAWGIADSIAVSIEFTTAAAIPHAREPIIRKWRETLDYSSDGRHLGKHPATPTKRACGHANGQPWLF